MQNRCRHRRVKPVDRLDLFAWADARWQPGHHNPVAVRWLRRCFPVAAGRAAPIADLAGIGAEVQP
jgi:hypothetical protein